MISSKNVWFDQRTFHLIKERFISSKNVWFDPRMFDLNKKCLIWSKNVWFDPRMFDLIQECLILSKNVWFDPTMFGPISLWLWIANDWLNYLCMFVFVFKNDNFIHLFIEFNILLIGRLYISPLKHLILDHIFVVIYILTIS